MRKAPIWILIVLSACLAQTAFALPTYSFVSDQPDYQVPLGASAEVVLYLRELLPPGESSTIVADNGLFSAGIEVARNSSLASDASIVNITSDPGFDGTAVAAVSGGLVTFYEDHSSGFGPGAMPDAEGLIRLGEVRIAAGASIGQVTTFTIADDSPLTSNTVTYAGHALDDNPGINSTSFTITTIIPEPAVLAYPLAVVCLLRRARASFTSAPLDH